MTLRPIFYAMLVALIGFGCGNSRSRAIGIVREIGFNELRLDLTLTVSDRSAHEIPQTEWSEYVRRFHPVAVQRHMGGVLIVISRVGREQEGLLVMLNREDDPGSGGSGASYDKIRDGLFWCVETIRDPYIPLEQRTNRVR